jgi:ankyrin repeat protein
MRFFLTFLKKSVYFKTRQMALFEAVKYNDLNLVQELIQSGENVNGKNDYGSTSLHVASMYGYTEIVKVLLQNGASPNEKNSYYGRTPLHLASRYGYIETVKELLFFGVDYTIQNFEGEDGLYGLTEEQRTLVLEECFSMEVKEPSVD